MIPKQEKSAFEERSQVLEACCRSPVTLQRDLNGRRDILLARPDAAPLDRQGSGSAAIVSLWRHRYAIMASKAARQAAAWQAADLYEANRQADFEVAG